MIDLEELLENMAYIYLLDLALSKSKCAAMNLGSEEKIKLIKINKGLSLQELKE